MRRGSRGTAVSQLQARLAILGAGIEVDGVFGNDTHRALIAFRKVHELKPDGIAGPKTWATLMTETEE
ncbi:peptidoglycan-binding domain-containing protein [Paenirhodobacter enshiensis]|uniref:peptidoglycan-binding domain-containing protein n=1 Tax=Paenirhodobacter enshiensis TaxID=1105367 RepID=UPI003FA23652